MINHIKKPLLSIIQLAMLVIWYVGVPQLIPKDYRGISEHRSPLLFISAYEIKPVWTGDIDRCHVISISDNFPL